MKKMMMIAAMMVATLTASAQKSVIEPGHFGLQPKVGLNLAKTTDKDTKFKAGIAAGIEGQYQVNDWFGLNLGVIYEQQGNATKITDQIKAVGIDKAKTKLEYLNIPVTARFYIAKGLSLGTGLQVGFLTKAKGDVEGDITKVANLDTNIKSNCNKVNLAIPMSLSYELPMGLTFDFRYQLGLTKWYKSDKNSVAYYLGAEPTGKNSVLQLTVGYKFGL